MRDFQQFSDPNRNGLFRRPWSPTCPLSPEEIRLAKLRAKLGNIEGKRVFVDELFRRRRSWL